MENIVHRFSTHPVGKFRAKFRLAGLIVDTFQSLPADITHDTMAEIFTTRELAFFYASLRFLVKTMNLKK